MTTRRHRHVAAVLLACAITLSPSPAYALRPAGPESSAKAELAAGLEEQETESNRKILAALARLQAQQPPVAITQAAVAAAAGVSDATVTNRKHANLAVAAALETARRELASAAGLEEFAMREQLERWAAAVDVQEALAVLNSGAVWLAPSTYLQALQTQQDPSPILHAPWQPPGFVQRATQMAVVALPEGQETLVIHVYGLGISFRDLKHHVGEGLPELGIWFQVHEPGELQQALQQRLARPGVVVHTEEFLRDPHLQLPDDYPRLEMKGNVLRYSPSALAIIALTPEQFSLDGLLAIEELHAVPFTVNGRRYAAVFFA